MGRNTYGLSKKHQKVLKFANALRCDQKRNLKANCGKTMSTSLICYPWIEICSPVRSQWPFENNGPLWTMEKITDNSISSSLSLVHHTFLA